MRTTFTTSSGTHECALRVTGASAVLATRTKNPLTVGQTITIGDDTWKVVSLAPSLYVGRVTNVFLRRIDDYQV